MKYIKGDLIKNANQFDVIGHGCNCFLNFGAGIAKTVKQTFPGAYKADLKTQYGDKKKLGKYTYIMYENLTVVNLYTQYKYTRTDVDADYDAIRNCMKALKRDFSGKKIGLPKIGCGLASGSWKIVEKIIKEELSGENVTIVIFNDRDWPNWISK